MLGDDFADAVGIQPGARLGGLHQQHGELVPAVAGHHVDAARVLHEDLGDLAQRVVAHGVAELVVDGLEAVEVQQDDRHRVVEASIARQLFLEPQREEAPVVEAGHLVLERRFLEPGVGGLQLLVGGVESRGEGVDLGCLLLDRQQHLVERRHERADLVAPPLETGDGGLTGHERSHACDDPAHIPDHVGAGQHADQREQHQQLQAAELDRLAGAQRGEDEHHHDEGEDQDGNHGGQRQRDQNLVTDALSRAGDVSRTLRLHR